MKRTLKSTQIIAAALLMSFVAVGPLEAGNDPSIKGALRQGIQSSMAYFIDTNTVQDSFYVFDAVKGQLLDLKLVKLHDGIVKKGDFFVSCADFVDKKGRKYDLDFLVVKDGAALRTVQALVHKADGKKRPYHLESN